MKSKSTWKDFLKDARGVFNAFTLISLLAGMTLVTSPLVTRCLGWNVLTRDELSTLTLIYCISALGDAALAIYLNKRPDLNVGTVENVESVTVDQSLPTASDETETPA